MIARLLAAVVAGLILSASAGATTAGADTTHPCGGQLAQLSTDVLAVPITSGKVDKERDALVKLVSSVSALAEAGKTADAVGKLANLQTKVDDLRTAGRISEESAALLTADVAAAAGCLAAA